MRQNHLNVEYLCTYCRTGFVDHVTAFPVAEFPEKRGFVVFVRLHDGGTFPLMDSRCRKQRVFQSIASLWNTLVRSGVEDWHMRNSPLPIKKSESEAFDFEGKNDAIH